MSTSALMNTYGRLPVTFTRGEGVWLHDDKGNKYLDTFTGIAVCGLGHAHPEVARAIADQAATLVHTSNWFHIAHQETLGEKLVALSGMDKVFFNNSGAEAVETAIKLARKYGHQRQIDKPAIIVTENSFHGRTMATLSATGNRKVQAGFEPLVSGFLRVPFNDLEAVAAVVRENPSVVAILVEPIQGEGGINIPDPDYLSGLRQICNEHQLLLMLDEIQSGMGRTGHWFAFQKDALHPDVMTLAKGLGNGFPIGACLARGAAAEILGPGNHGTTFGGNPLACRAALATIEVMEKENLLARAHGLGEWMLADLQSRFAGHAGVREVRGSGLLMAVELEQPCLDIMSMGLEQGVLINVTAGNVVRVLPALTASDDEAKLMVEKVSAVIDAFLARSAS